VRALVCALVLAAATTANAADGTGGIAVLASGRDPRREAVLVDALRIYTRDLGRSVRVAGAAPTTLDADAIAAVAAQARADGDEIVVWFGARDGAPVLLALRAPTSELRETAVERDEPLRTARTLALKVRALVTTDAPRDWSVPPEADAVREAAPPSPTAPSAATPAAAPPPATPAAPPADTTTTAAPTTTGAPAAPAASAGLRIATVTRPAPRSDGDRIELAAEYGVIVPTDPTWLRHGLFVRVAAPLGRRPLALFADAAFTTAPSTTVDGSRVAARVWPVGLGLALRLRRTRWQLSGGPRASLQIVDVDARAADGRVAAARLYSAGLGLAGDARFRATRNVAVVASLTVEALLPRLQLAAGGAGATDLGWVQLGLSTGLVFSAP
jgi:hypothetical protein